MLPRSPSIDAIPNVLEKTAVHGTGNLTNITFSVPDVRSEHVSIAQALPEMTKQQKEKQNGTKLNQ